MSAVDDSVSQLFTKGSHHKRISVLYLVQNFYDKGSHHITISLNAHYLINFKDPRDGAQISVLASQMYPKHSKFLVEAYQDATSKAHGYILIDLRQTTPDDLRIRTDIFKDDIMHVYIPPKGRKD
jgi:hypothetical protein